jgi:heme oxygenase
MIIIRSLSKSSAQGYAARYDVCDIDRSLHKSWYATSAQKALSGRIEDEIGNAPSLFGKLTEKHKLLESRQQYIGFLKAQLVMHSTFQPLYDDALLQRQFPQHSATNIITEIVFDLINFRQEKNENLVAIKCLPQGFMNRLGWLYSSELLASMFATWRNIASERGFTEKFGVSHFAPRVDNSFRWPLLIKAMDRLSLSEVEEERIYAGARSAMGLFEKQVRYICDPCRPHRVVSGQ